MEKLLCGIDLGGTKLSIGLVDGDNGKVLDTISTNDHAQKVEDGIIEDIVCLVRKLLEKNNVRDEDLMGIGVVFPGHIRAKDGITITTSNFATGFKNFPFRQRIQEAFPKVPVFTDNDANAQAYAEYKYGAGKGYENLIFMTVSTGIGAGIIVDGALMRGMTGTAGEVGHTIINPNSKRKCTCGNYGCLMPQACGLFLGDMAVDWLKAGVKNDLGVTLENAHDKVDGFLVKKGLDKGDELAKAIMIESADSVAIALYNLFQLFNPSAIVLGGGLINWGPVYIDRITERFHELAGDMLVDEMKILTTGIGENSGIIGAASLSLEHI